MNNYIQEKKSEHKILGIKEKIWKEEHLAVRGYINSFLNSSVVSTFVTVLWGSFVGVLGPIYWLCVDWIISTAQQLNL